MRSEFAAVRQESAGEFSAVRGEFVAVRQEFGAQLALLRKDMDALASKLVIQLGARIVVVAGLMTSFLTLA
jgi:hypothetical protein